MNVPPPLIELHRSLASRQSVLLKSSDYCLKCLQNTEFNPVPTLIIKRAASDQRPGLVSQFNVQ